MKITLSAIIILLFLLVTTGCDSSWVYAPTEKEISTATKVIPSTATATATLKPTETLVQATETMIATTTKPVITIQRPTKTPTCFPSPIGAELQNPVSLQDYVGYIVRDLPEYLQERMGAVILGRGDYGLREVIRTDSSHMLWFEKVACRDADSKAYWEILDVIELPPLSDNEELVIWYCRLEGEDDTDPELVAIGNYEPGTQYLTKVKMVWRFNRQTNQIETIPAEGIECLRDTGEGHP